PTPFTAPPKPHPSSPFTVIFHCRRSLNDNALGAPAVSPVPPHPNQLPPALDGPGNLRRRRRPRPRRPRLRDPDRRPLRQRPRPRPRDLHRRPRHLPPDRRRVGRPPPPPARHARLRHHPRPRPGRGRRPPPDPHRPPVAPRPHIRGVQLRRGLLPTRLDRPHPADRQPGKTAAGERPHGTLSQRDLGHRARDLRRA